jgi:hypothetical protein
MTPTEREYFIAVLKVLLNIDDIAVMKYTIESLLESLEENQLLDDEED